MTLPRFTSGQVGSLEFSHLNEAFERIEALSASPEVAAMKASDRTDRVIVAKILAKQGTGSQEVGSFEEVALTSPTSGEYEAIPGGIKSTDGTNPYNAPIVAPVSPVGSIVTLLASVAKNGKLHFREFAPHGGEGEMYKVVDAVEAESSYENSRRWKYTLQPVSVTSAGSWADASPNLFEGFNGAENAVDGVLGSTRYIGVGSAIPANTNASRERIKNGVVVGPCRRSNGYLVFSLTNGYRFTC